MKVMGNKMNSLLIQLQIFHQLFVSPDFAKAINASLSFFETISLYNDKIQIK